MISMMTAGRQAEIQENTVLIRAKLAAAFCTPDYDQPFKSFAREVAAAFVDRLGDPGIDRIRLLTLLGDHSSPERKSLARDLSVGKSDLRAVRRAAIISREVNHAIQRRVAALRQ